MYAALLMSPGDTLGEVVYQEKETKRAHTTGRTGGSINQHPMVHLHIFSFQLDWARHQKCSVFRIH